MTALRLTAVILALALAFLAGVALAAPHDPRTCARVPNGVVCWHGAIEPGWSVR